MGGQLRWALCHSGNPPTLFCCCHLVLYIFCCIVENKPSLSLQTCVQLMSGLGRKSKVKIRIAVCKQASPLRELTHHMGSHSITCHPAEVTFPPLPQPKLVRVLCRVPGKQCQAVVALRLVVPRDAIDCTEPLSEKKSIELAYICLLQVCHIPGAPDSMSAAL